MTTRPVLSQQEWLIIRVALIDKHNRVSLGGYGDDDDGWEVHLHKIINYIPESVDLINGKNQLPFAFAMIPAKLTEEDWNEIYYALDTMNTRAAPNAVMATVNSSLVLELKALIEKIGPDGTEMYE
jgi:hypothetical protein